MCDPFALWGSHGRRSSLCTASSNNNMCNRLLVCARNVPEQAPRQQSVTGGMNSYQDAESVALSASERHEGLRARSSCTSTRRVDTSPEERGLSPKALEERMMLLAKQEGGFLCTSSLSTRSPIQSPLKVQKGLATNLLLAVDGDNLTSLEDDSAAPCRTLLFSTTPKSRRFRRGTSLGGLHRLRRRSSSKHQSKGRRHSVPAAQCQEQPQERRRSVGGHATETLLRAAKDCPLQSQCGTSWDWPLSRSEKKSLVLMIDRQVLLMDQKEMEEEVAHLRRCFDAGRL